MSPAFHKNGGGGGGGGGEGKNPCEYIFFK